MKKKILSLALVALSLGAFSATAQNTANCSNTANNQTEKTCTKTKKCSSDKGNRPNPYEGLNLSDSQKTQLRQLDSKRIEAHKQQLQNRKAKMQKNREMKMQNDSVKFAERRAAKLRYLEEVKEIIGPDNYVVFLENFYINGGQPGQSRPNKDFRMGQNNGKFKAMKGDRKDSKGDRKGHKGDRRADINKQQATL